ncbi:hypothetical protein G6F65_023025 [Rhizopus arrhizus]|nr:hypothetical protein G6F65_023025 [Rhizopus arrhizus]
MDVTVAPGAQVNAPLGDASAILLTGNNTRFSNQGTVEPTGGLTPFMTSGVTIGNATNSLVAVKNGGTINGTAGLLSSSLPNVQGVALNIQNGAFDGAVCGGS